MQFYFLKDSFDCGLNDGCGSESWLIANSDYLNYVTGGTCKDSTAFSALTQGICLCPPATSISPCTCDLTAGSTTTLTVTCAGHSIDDTTMEGILTTIAPTSYAVDTFDLSGNSLSYVPNSLVR